jgi:CysZ protein
VPEWLQFLSWIITPLLWLVGGLMTGYVSTLLVLMLTSPFHALLAEKVEELVTGEPCPRWRVSLPRFLEVPRAYFENPESFSITCPMALAVLLLTIIPVFNAFRTAWVVLLGAWMMSLQFVDYPMDNHRLPFRDVRTPARRRAIDDWLWGHGRLFHEHPTAQSGCDSRCGDRRHAAVVRGVTRPALTLRHT